MLRELLFGARTPKARETVQTLLEAWEMLPVDRRVAEQAAKMRRELAGRGKTVGMADCMTAATALLCYLKVVTANVKDFALVSVVPPEQIGFP